MRRVSPEPHPDLDPQEQFDDRLAEALAERGMIDEQERQECLTEQVVMGGTLSLNLWELGLADAGRLTEVGAELVGLPPADSKAAARASKELLGLISRQLVEEHRILPLSLRDNVLRLATATPWRVDTCDAVRFHTGCEVECLYMCDVSLVRLLDRLYGIPARPRYRANPTPRLRVEELRGPGEEEHTLEELSTEDQFLALYARDLVEDRGTDGAAAPRSSSARAVPDPTARPALPPAPPARARDLRRALAALGRAGSREEIGEAVTSFCLTKAKRVALFTCRSSKWLGWTGAGRGISAERVRSMVVPLSAGSVFALLDASGSLYLGPLAPLPVHDCFLAALGGIRPGTVALVPVRYQRRMVFALYLDDGEGADLTPDVREIVALAGRVPAALQRLVRARGSDSRYQR